MKSKSPLVRKLEYEIADTESYINVLENSLGMGGRIGSAVEDCIKHNRKFCELKKKELEEKSSEMVEINDDFFVSEIERLNGETMWNLNKYLDEDSDKIDKIGYFGSFYCITYYERQAIVFVDDSGKIQFKTPFYDHIYYGNKACWSADTRFNSGDCSIVIRTKDGYNLISKKSNGLPMCKEWFNNMDKYSYYDRENGRYFNAATKDGEQVKVSDGGYIIQEISQKMDEVKKLTRDEILDKWINAGKLVVGGFGWKYRGSGEHVIPNDVAASMFPKYDFGKGFYELSWTIYKGEVALSMREYSENDME